MIICNSVAIAIVAARSLLSRSTSPTEMPTGFGKFDLATLIAAMSLGHILGVGFSLGLTNLGII
jgi:photosystem I reaction center subunit PsaK